MSKKDLWLHLTIWGSAASVCGLLIAGFLILHTSASLPDASSIKGVELKIPLRVYSSEGLLISEFGNERRRPVSIEDTPSLLIDAILASEDDAFYSHSGIDITGLVRAAVSNFRAGQTQQGASTITMQVARNFFLSREKTYSRKLREVLLAIKLEQILTKDEILSLYLNKIFLGHRAYGFAAAADVFYGKSLSELSLAEMAMLAGLPKAPSANNPLRNPGRAVTRRNYVLQRLLTLGRIDQATFAQASQAEVSASKHARSSDLTAPHIAEMVRAALIERLGEQGYWQGLNVYTTIQARQQRAAEQALRRGLQSYDRRHGFRGPVAQVQLSDLDSAEPDEESPYDILLRSYPSSGGQVPALVLEVNRGSARLRTEEAGEIDLSLAAASWARAHINANQVGDPPQRLDRLLAVGDIVYVQPMPQDSNAEAETEKKIATDADVPTPLVWQLSQIPDVSGALISMDPNSGAILSLVGGYDFFLNKYNRAIQSIRQPGSNIKPFIYSAALDKGFTPASLVSGAPIVITDQTHGTVWRPENYSGEFFGPTRIREALSKSLNLVSIRLLRAIGVPYAREYAARFGIDVSRFSPTLTMALGSGGITPLEMLTAYSGLANGGYKIEPYFIKYVTNRNGRVVFQGRQPELCDECYRQFVEPVQDSSPVVDENAAPQPVVADPAVPPPGDADVPAQTYSAPRIMSRGNNFLTVSMLKDVVRRGTARKALALNRSDLAGKTGTTNDYVDAWFSGFNSQVATTVWIGFDDPVSMGRGEAGSRAALPIWVDYMQTALQDVPEDVDEVPPYISAGWVDRNTGEQTAEEDPAAVREYFVVDDLLPMWERSSVIAAGLDENAGEEFSDAPEAEPLLGELIDEPEIEPIIEDSDDTEGLF
ncbi:MAG: penicillin-binding protein 1A [Gammaproteobacteria bacterium]|nr:penicillin-binding protein 1A [Gammaproteobacteria bacterium]